MVIIGKIKFIFILLFSFLLNNCSNDFDKKPNVVWFVYEDQSQDFFPQYSNTPMNLPAIESLADDGVVFKNMHSPSAVCAPSRSAIITGMYPTTLGTHNMRTYNSYKTAAGLPNQAELGIPSYSPEFPEYIRPFTEYLREAGYYCTNNSKEDYNFKISDNAWDESSNKAHWKNREKNQPFFSIFNFNVCHESGIWNKNKDSILVDKSKIIIPPYFPNNDIIRHDMAVNYSNLIRADRKLLKLINELKKEGEYDNTYIFFYSDHGGPFPRHKRAIYQSGTKVPLIIKAPKGKLIENDPSDLISFIDLAPTLLSISGINIPEYIQGKAFLGSQKVNSHKLIFTATDRFDGEIDKIRAVFDGRYKFIKNYNQNIPHALNVQYRLQMPMMQELLRLKNNGSLNEVQKKWFESPKPKEEFYDVLNDPYEINNLINEPQYIDIIDNLRTSLIKWREDSNDLGDIPEMELIPDKYLN
ncbi:MAG: sulfatase [Flavobacteriaceae bacterium]|nr:sulfatase [Flavobacteriaceae bacterium]